MAYFNHAFQKAMVATQGLWTGNGTTADMANAGVGVIGVFDTNYNKLASLSANPEKPFIIASTSSFGKDKMGKFYGGYMETDKSKVINPKYVSKVWVEEGTDIQQCEYIIGGTYTNANAKFVSCASDDPCTFPTGETFYLRVEAKGDPAMAFSTHNLYHDVEAYTGCASYDEDGKIVCANESMVYTQWLRGIAESEILNEFVSPILVVMSMGSDNAINKKYYFMTNETRMHLNESGTNVSYTIHDGYDDFTTANDYLGLYVIYNDEYTLVTNNNKSTVVDTPGTDVAYDKFNSIEFETSGTLVDGHFYEISFVKDGEYVDGAFDITDVTDVITTASDYKYALVLRGAYYETKFGNCSWNKRDGYEIQPIRVFAQQVDVNGNVCEDQFICGYESHPAVQGNGYGEEKLRKFILSQSYKQNFVADDVRIREITMGTEILDAVPRNAIYDSLFILHSVPRFNNPTGTFDNDQYCIELIFQHGSADVATLVGMFEDILDDNGAEELPSDVQYTSAPHVGLYTTNVTGYTYVVSL